MVNGTYPFVVISGRFPPDFIAIEILFAMDVSEYRLRLYALITITVSSFPMFLFAGTGDRKSGGGSSGTPSTEGRRAARPFSLLAARRRFLFLNDLGLVSSWKTRTYRDAFLIKSY